VNNGRGPEKRTSGLRKPANMINGSASLVTADLEPMGVEMANESFDVNWTDVDLMNQRTDMSCWAASAAMVVGWRDRVCIVPSAIAAGTGDWAAYANGLQPADIQTLANVWRLTAEAPQCYTIDGLRDLLQAKSPLWVAAAVPTLHAIVVTGMYSDGSADNTFVRINDPWDRDPGTPCSPGAYLNTHDHGSQYVLNLQQFTQEYETPGTYPSVTVQILHPEGRS
jgi:hypothetical protein